MAARSSVWITKIAMPTVMPSARSPVMGPGCGVPPGAATTTMTLGSTTPGKSIAKTVGSIPVRGFSLTPIGHVRTPWSPGNCPKNMAAAREAGRAATLMIDPPWRDGLTGLDRASHLILLGWFGDVDRDVLLQKPPHLSVAQGCFALRTPARPNPIGVSIVRRTSLGLAAGLITVDGLDWFDGTALIDIKPYYPSTDLHPDAQVIEP